MGSRIKSIKKRKLPRCQCQKHSNLNKDLIRWGWENEQNWVHPRDRSTDGCPKLERNIASTARVQRTHNVDPQNTTTRWKRSQCSVAPPASCASGLHSNNCAASAECGALRGSGCVERAFEMELVHMSSQPCDANRLFFMTNYSGVGNFDPDDLKENKGNSQLFGSSIARQPEGGASSSDEEGISASALSNCISIIESRRLTRDDITSIRQVVTRMVEFASYQAAAAMSPGIVLALENYQERMWAAEFDRMISDGAPDPTTPRSSLKVEKDDKTPRAKKTPSKQRKTTHQRTRSAPLIGPPSIEAETTVTVDVEARSATWNAIPSQPPPRRYLQLHLPIDSVVMEKKVKTKRKSSPTPRPVEVTLHGGLDLVHDSSDDINEHGPSLSAIRRPFPQRNLSSGTPKVDLSVMGSLKPIHADTYLLKQEEPPCAAPISVIGGSVCVRPARSPSSAQGCEAASRKIGNKKPLQAQEEVFKASSCIASARLPSCGVPNQELQIIQGEYDNRYTFSVECPKDENARSENQISPNEQSNSASTCALSIRKPPPDRGTLVGFPVRPHKKGADFFNVYGLRRAEEPAPDAKLLVGTSQNADNLHGNPISLSEAGHPRRKGRRKARQRRHRANRYSRSSQNEQYLALEPIPKTVMGSQAKTNVYAPDSRRPRRKQSAQGTSSSSRAIDAIALRSQESPGRPQTRSRNDAEDSDSGEKKDARVDGGDGSTPRGGKHRGRTPSDVDTDIERSTNTSRRPTKPPSSRKSQQSAKWNSVRLSCEAAVTKRLREIMRMQAETMKSETKGGKGKR